MSLINYRTRLKSLTNKKTRSMSLTNNTSHLVPLKIPQYSLLPLANYTSFIIIIIILGQYRSTCWMKALALFIPMTICLGHFCFHVTDLQKSFTSSLHLFESLSFDRLPSMRLQSVNWDAQLFSWTRATWPAQVHFLAGMTCLMYQTLVLLLAHLFVLWSC